MGCFFLEKRRITMIKAVVTGNLTKDIEKKKVTKKTKEGVEKEYFVCSDVSVAFTDYGSETPTYIRLILWGSDIDRYAKFLKKGDSVLVNGRLRMREYSTKQGEKRQVLEFDKVYDIEKLFGKKKEEKKDEAPKDDAGNKNAQPEVMEDVIDSLDSFVDIPDLGDEEDLPF